MQGAGAKCVQNVTSLMLRDEVAPVVCLQTRMLMCMQGAPTAIIGPLAFSTISRLNSMMQRNCCMQTLEVPRRRLCVESKETLTLRSPCSIKNFIINENGNLRSQIFLTLQPHHNYHHHPGPMPSRCHLRAAVWIGVSFVVDPGFFTVTDSPSSSVWLKRNIFYDFIAGKDIFNLDAFSFFLGAARVALRTEPQQ